MALLSAASLVTTTVGAAAAPIFDDVDYDDSPHAEAITALAEQKIIEGRVDGSFDPSGRLTRAQFASIVARAAGLESSDATPFPDVTGGPHAKNIAAAADAGIILGYKDGKFRPGATIQRDQVAAMLYRWLRPPAADRAAFSDLHLTTHAAAINALAEVDVVYGKNDRTFDPAAKVRRDQSASMVFRGLRYLKSLEPTGPNPWDEIGRDALRTEMPEGDISGVSYHGTIVHPDHGAPNPENPDATLNLAGGTSGVNPVRYEHGEALVTSGSFGLRIYDVRDPYAPKLLGELPRAELALPGDDPTRNYHSSESMNIDKQRMLAFLSRDPRAFSNPQTSGPSGFYIIDIADPTAPEVLHFQQVGAGHTTTCVNSCQQLWSGGPSRATTDPEDWIARPIFVSDVSGVERVDGEIVGLESVFTYKDPVDIGRYRGITDYAHDVQVDQQGVAWVSGRGGIRGYWTEGRHFDPLLGRERTAFAHNPVPYAGGEVGEYTGLPAGDARRMNGAIHNLERPVDGPDGDSAWLDSERPRRPGAGDGATPGGDYAPGELVYVVDENFTAPCTDSGKFYIASLKGADQGQAWRTADEVAEEGPFELDEIGRWSVAGKEGTNNPNSSCSAHYFNMKDGIVAGGWYGQGFRFLDVTDPTDPIQIAYYRPNQGSGWSVHWIGEVIYANDTRHGIHILTLDGDAAHAASTRTEVLAPPMTAQQAAFEEDLVADPVFGWSCALPASDLADEDVPSGDA
ncbi:S-layer homology domain-containing protein [Egicoccus sp. AB-alg2]|uniref:S-layer homology domain-containing protein n=1 Tax=Egicoccus sp. AB-alg2 TaxID=3242693 RepID=UPI00359F0AA3